MRAINTAQTTIVVASTRVRLEPILNALVGAAERGVNVRVLINQDDFSDLYKRSKWLLHPKVQTRVKFFNLRKDQYLSHQMHDKFIVVDDSTVLTGSFNWSLSSENTYIENLNEFTGAMGQALAQTYTQEFLSLWDMHRLALSLIINAFR